MTVLVTTWRTLTLPGLPLSSASLTVGENEALHGAALTGVELKGDPTDCADGRPADGMPVEYGDRGMFIRGVRADRGPGLAKGDGGIVTRGDSGLCLVVLALLF